MNKIKLFIFDMDGLLLETGRLAYRAYVNQHKSMIMKCVRKSIIY